MTSSDLADSAAEWVLRPSPNFGARRAGGRPAMVVLHYTGMPAGMAAVKRLCDPAARVSAHYLIDADGTVARMVDEEMRAWHAGQGGWGAVRDVNSWSIGIEIANPGHHLGYPPFPERQIAALERLLGAVMARWSIPPERVIGHACMAPGRKLDPGEKLDWRRLARRGLAVWLDRARRDPGPAEAARFQAAARRFGYVVPLSNEWCAPTLAAWRAFAMRFLPSDAGDEPRADGVLLLEALATRWPAGRLP